MAHDGNIITFKATHSISPWILLETFSQMFPLVIYGASLVAQLVKNPPAMQETPVRFLGWEDLLEKG